MSALPPKADITGHYRHDRFRAIRRHERRADELLQIAIESNERRQTHALNGEKLNQARSLSGKLTKTSTPRITVAMRNAASCAFQTFDCHIAKYSPATTMTGAVCAPGRREWPQFQFRAVGPSVSVPEVVPDWGVNLGKHE